MDQRLGSPDGFGGYRTRLVEALRARGISDMRVLAAVAEIPRHLFVPSAVRHRAYEDSALPIGGGQTISQPYVQALMLQLLQLDGTGTVLEIGTGSGYQTALLGRLAARVVSLERLPALATEAQVALAACGVRNVTVLVGDGTLGWPAAAPYDAIVVAAGGPDVPPPLRDQLAPGGRLAVPVGERDQQRLVVVTRTPAGFSRHEAGLVRFVPLIGQHGHAG